MSCEAACLELIVSICESPVLHLGLTANTTYKASLNRPGSSHITRREVTSDGAGAITLNAADYPAGFFGYGYLELEILKGAQFDEIQEITRNGITYKCILLEMADIDE